MLPKDSPSPPVFLLDFQEYFLEDVAETARGANFAHFLLRQVPQISRASKSRLPPPFLGSLEEAAGMAPLTTSANMTTEHLCPSSVTWSVWVGAEVQEVVDRGGF